MPWGLIMIFILFIWILFDMYKLSETGIAIEEAQEFLLDFASLSSMQYLPLYLSMVPNLGF